MTEETNLINNEEYDHDKIINIINTSNPRTPRVDEHDYMPDVNKNSKSIRNTIT